MTTKRLRLEMQNLTELIIYTGYENRLVAGESPSGEGDIFKWYTWDKDEELYPGMTPLLAGNRVITPEELDPSLAKALRIDKNLKWRSYQVGPPKDTPPSTISQLFDTYEFKMEKERSGNRRAETKSTDELAYAENWSNIRLERRIQLIEELDTIFSKEDEDLKYKFKQGLVLRLDKVIGPLEILQWVYDQNYCSGATEPLQFDEMEYVESGDHKILILSFDAESG